MPDYKVVDAEKLDATFKATADSIRGKTGKTDLIPEEDMPSEIDSIPTGGDTSIEDGLITKTLTYYRNDRVTSLPSYSFNNWLEPITLVFPNVTSLGNYTFMNAFKIRKLDFYKLSNMTPQYMIHGSINFEALILRSPVLCNLTRSSAFNQDGIANGTGYIYVPKALIEEYKVATNWVTYANQFRAIEDYPEICGGAE